MLGYKKVQRNMTYVRQSTREQVMCLDKTDNADNAGSCDVIKDSVADKGQATRNTTSKAIAVAVFRGGAGQLGSGDYTLRVIRVLS